MWSRSLNWEDSLEESMAIHSSILAQRIPWTEEPGRLQSIELQSQTWLKWLKVNTQKKKDFFLARAPWIKKTNKQTKKTHGLSIHHNPLNFLLSVNTFSFSYPAGVAAHPGCRVWTTILCWTQISPILAGEISSGLLVSGQQLLSL